MSHWESEGATDEWYTPKYIFDSMGAWFDLDVAHPAGQIFTPASRAFSDNSLSEAWNGTVWMNPPFGGRNSLTPWLEKFFDHGDGVALTPDRTSAPWYHYCLSRADALLVVSGKVKFLRPDGSQGKSPSTGTTLWASGLNGVSALINSEINGLGVMLCRKSKFYEVIL